GAEALDEPPRGAADDDECDARRRNEGAILGPHEDLCVPVARIGLWPRVGAGARDRERSAEGDGPTERDRELGRHAGLACRERAEPERRLVTERRERDRRQRVVGRPERLARRPRAADLRVVELEPQAQPERAVDATRETRA